MKPNRSKKETTIIAEKTVLEIQSKKYITDNLIDKTCVKNKINPNYIRKILGR